MNELLPRERFCAGFCKGKKDRMFGRKYHSNSDDFFCRQGYNSGWYSSVAEKDEVGLIAWVHSIEIPVEVLA